MQSCIIVPRLAAAAFTFGLGAAVLSGAGHAFATPTAAEASSASSGSASSDDAGSDETGGRTVDSDESDARDEADDDSAADADEATDKPTGGDPDEEPTDDKSSDEEPADEGSSDEDTSTGDVDEPAIPPDRDDDAGSATTDDFAADGAVADDTNAVAPEQDSDDAAAPTAAEPAAPIRRPDAPAVTIPQLVAAVPTVTAVAARPAPSPWDIAVDDFVINAAVIFGYAPTDSPRGVPPLRTLLADAYAGLRRVVFGGQANVAPTLTPVQVRQLLSGEVIGDLLAFDHNGDRLSYRVTQGPARGDVTVNANGTYVYTPARELAGSGGTDTFTVVIDDGRGVGSPQPHLITVNVTPTVGRWRGYHLDNLTTGNATLYGIRGDTGDYSGPGKNHIIHAATRMNFQVDEYAFKYRDVHLDLVGADGATWTISAHVPPSVRAQQPETQCVTSGGACDPASTTVGQRAALLSSATVIITKDAAVEADVHEIAALLKTYCADGKVAECSFQVTRQDDKALGARHQVGGALINPSTEKQSTTISVSDTVSESDSVNVSAKLSGGILTKLASLINVEITAAYGHTWTKTHTFTQSVTMTVPPQHIGTIYATQPVYRSWGDFTVKVGKTTHHLKNVYFDTPRDDGRAPSGGYVTDTQPITPETLAALPPGTTLVVMGDAPPEV